MSAVAALGPADKDGRIILMSGNRGASPAVRLAAAHRVSVAYLCFI